MADNLARSSVRALKEIVARAGMDPAIALEKHELLALARLALERLTAEVGGVQEEGGDDGGRAARDEGHGDAAGGDAGGEDEDDEGEGEAGGFDYDGDAQEVKIDAENPVPDANHGLDIGSETCEKIKDVLERAQTIVWSGLFGVAECGSFQTGTREVVEMIVSEHDEKEKPVFAIGASTLKWMGHFTGNEDADGALLGNGESLSHAFADTALCLMLLQGGSRPGVRALLEREPINDTEGDTMELELEEKIKAILEAREPEDEDEDEDDEEGDY